MCCGSPSPLSSPIAPSLNPFHPQPEASPYKKIIVLSPTYPKGVPGSLHAPLLKRGIETTIQSIFRGLANYTECVQEDVPDAPFSPKDTDSIPERQTHRAPLKPLTLHFKKSDLSPPSAPQQVSVCIETYTPFSPFLDLDFLLDQPEEPADRILCIGRKTQDIDPFSNNVSKYEKDWNTSLPRIEFLSLSSDTMLCLGDDDAKGLTNLFMEVLSRPQRAAGQAATRT